MIPYVRGRVARQAHVELPPGTFEEEYARSGFSGRYAHLYRPRPPVAWSRIEGPLRPRAFDLREAPPPAGDYLADRVVQLHNEDCTIAFARLEAPMPYFFRNADGDEVLFVHAGEGTLESDFGPIAYRRGDYLVIPRGTVYRLVPKGPTALLVIVARGEFRVPDRGMLGQHALFDPAIVDVPSPSDGPATTLAPNEAGEFALRILRGGALTTVWYPHAPVETVGWKGTLSVQRLSVHDIRPVLSDRYHLPPSAHTTFLAEGVVLCTFLPRPLENGDPEALKVPFFHANIDFDEVLFYHDGEFFSRTGVAPGMLTFHPAGIHHGPQPGAAERSRGAARTEEIAVMIDTRRPLIVAPSACGERAGYWQSWKEETR